MSDMRRILWTAIVVTAGSFLLVGAAGADILHLDDVIATFSLCVGFDCVNGESFGFDTIRLKENNLRIHFNDTSNSGSFPTNDWRIVINDSANGGASYFAIEDSDAGRQIFRVDAGAPANSLRVDSAGDVGVGTSNPVVELHVIDGDTPTLRLDQDGSSGFTPQVWDVAGNETNFFVRDATNGSTLPFRIEPGASSNAIYVDGDDDIGFGTNSPSGVDCGAGAAADCAVHVRRSNGSASIYVEETSGTAEQRIMLVLENNGAVQTEMRDTSLATWRFGLNNNGDFVINDTGDLATAEMRITTDGTVFVNGGQVHPDYVFEPDYELLPLAELARFVAENKRLPKVQSAAERAETGLNLTDLPLQLLEKVEELTLYTIRQQQAIDELRQRLSAVEQVRQ